MSDWSGELTALEQRAEAESLEHLHAERRLILPEYAGLKALHGPNGKFDNKRKALLEAMKIRARMDMTSRGEKITEGAVDAYAHADQQYVDFIDRGISDHTRYVELETRVNEIEEQITNRTIVLSVFGKEATIR